LAALLQSKESRLVQAGLMGLSGLRADEVRTRLLKNTAENAEKHLGRALVMALRRRGREAVPFLISALGVVSNDFKKEDIIDALGAIGERSDGVVNALTQVLNGEHGKEMQNPYVQVAVIRSLQQLDPSSDLVKTVLLRFYDKVI